MKIDSFFQYKNIFISVKTFLLKIRSGAKYVRGCLFRKQDMEDERKLLSHFHSTMIDQVCKME